MKTECSLNSNSKYCQNNTIPFLCKRFQSAQYSPVNLTIISRAKVAPNSFS